MMPMTTFTSNGEVPAPWARALVTGGAGFLGSHLCARLLDSGVEVDCLDDLSTGRAENVAPPAGRAGLRFLECDIADPACTDALTGPYDLVVHLAGPGCPADRPVGPVEVLDTASLGTRHALAVAGRDGARFLLASSPPAHGDPRPPGGDDPVGPHSACTEAARFAEALVAAHAGHGSDAGIVRLYGAYGPRMRTDDGRTVSALLRQALAGEPVTVTGDGSAPHSLCYVDDTVDGMLLVAASRSVRPVDVGCAEETTELELARRVIELAGTGAPLTFVDGTSGAPPGRPHTGFAQELFGWVPRVSREEGLRRTVAWFRRPPPAPAPAVAGPGGERLP
ncbi:epimerase [Streptomyces fumigatiscleroticus]|nr:epimerase [Streptomyces fumigatiscleroticus]